MDDQKLENLLNLSLDATQTEREKSLVLAEGYTPSTHQWELIVKYTGDIAAFAPYVVRAVPLLNEYAIVRIEEEMLPAFAALDQVEFMEQPKRLFFSAAQGVRASCIPAVQRKPPALLGAGILLAVIDSGADIFNVNFRNEDGTTRILALWDQTAPALEEQETTFPGVGGILGRVYTQDELNEILMQDGAGSYAAAGRRTGGVPGEDLSGHGTAVLGIAAGYSAPSGTQNASYQGVAPKAKLLVVKLGTPEPDGFPRTTQLMQGVDFAVRFALDARLPVAVNLSFGNSYGPHDATSLLSQYLDDLANYWKSVLVIGTGNEGAKAGHASISLRDMQPQTVRLGVGTYEPGLNVQLWKRYTDTVQITVIAPDGTRYEVPMARSGAHRVRMQETALLLFIGEPGPYSVDQEIFIDFLPTDTYVDAGEWQFLFEPERVADGAIDLWLPGGGVLSADTGFLDPAAALTLTIPSTAQRAISAAAYDSRRDTAADFSGRGSAQLGKPDLAAPGVDILAPVPGGGYASFSGTSMAAPFVTGSAALLMEWGIANGNDPYLYGEKVKAYLQRGARRLPGFSDYPNAQIGYGALCVAESLPHAGF